MKKLNRWNHERIFDASVTHELMVFYNMVQKDYAHDEFERLIDLSLGRRDDWS